MRRYFNTEGKCMPGQHYMAPLEERLSKIKKLYVDRGKYFVINRSRQYGKTTTLMELAKYLRDDYVVVSMDFQEISSANFESEGRFVAAFIRCLINVLVYGEAGSEMEILRKKAALLTEYRPSMDELFTCFSQMCEGAENPIVLMIDEVDSASNNQVFIDFLAMFRRYYLNRENRPIFHSVILAGVYDIKNLKLKIRPDDEHQYNSPWNIAAKFNIDMSFSAEQISHMLESYEEDNRTGMDVQNVSQCIYEYTSGYPYLVSAICKIFDEEIYGNDGFENIFDVWTREGVAEAVKQLLKENTPLFDSLAKQLDRYKELRKILEDIIYQGKQISYTPDVKAINLGTMFGLLREENGHVVVANRIFEMRFLNMFITEEAIRSEAYRYGDRDSNQFTTGGKLNMELVLKKFVEHFSDIYGGNDEKFIESYGRKFFLLYLKPIINGKGNYYMEAQTRDARRTDLIVEYSGEQFIVELKIWHGNEYNERGEKQLTDYLDYFHQKKGYMLSLNFNKKKKTGVKTIEIGDRTIIEAIV